MIALIPARAGSKRVTGKNTRVLAGHPLLAYSIAAAKAAKCIESVYVSTESEDIAEVAHRYGAEWIPRPIAFASDTSPDIEWVKEAVAFARDDYYALLRPTSPFRTAETIDRAFDLFMDGECHSLRAIEKVEQHPGKMWILVHPDRIYPLFPGMRGHSEPTQTLPDVYVQNASLEMFTRETITTLDTLSGYDICPFLTREPEGYDINTEKDWIYAEAMVASGTWTLPAVEES